MFLPHVFYALFKFIKFTASITLSALVFCPKVTNFVTQSTRKTVELRAVHRPREQKETCPTGPYSVIMAFMHVLCLHACVVSFQHKL